jgi:hypothetical protein
VSSPKRLIPFVLLAASFSAAWTADTFAQGRRGGHVVSRPVIVARPYFYDPFLYDPFWSGPLWYDAQWGMYPPYGYPPYRYYNVDPGASVKLEVKPKQAEVYVDGYYAGVVDDFDGTFQRLRVTPGEHEIELYLEGYRTVHEKVYLQPDNTFKVKRELERLPSGEQAEPRPQPANPMPSAGPGNQPPMYPQPPPRGNGRRPQGPQGPPPQGPPPMARDPRGADNAAFGSLSIRVQPGDADITVDGEKWRAPEGQDRVVIELPEGRHTIEIQKSGYRTYVTDVDVRRGETTPLNVSLRSQE